MACPNVTVATHGLGLLLLQSLTILVARLERRNMSSKEQCHQQGQSSEIEQVSLWSNSSSDTSSSLFSLSVFLKESKVTKWKPNCLRPEPLTHCLQPRLLFTPMRFPILEPGSARGHLLIFNSWNLEVKVEPEGCQWKHCVDEASSSIERHRLCSSRLKPHLAWQLPKSLAKPWCRASS